MLPVFQPGEFTEVAPDDLAIPKARQLASLVTRGLPFVHFLRAERHDFSRYEAVIIEVDVELGQKSIHPIQRVEPLAFIFDPEDRVRQDVWTLRPGFPITPHQNLTTTPEPRSLCLYEETYAEQKARWSAFGLLERAREWLRLTARGELHQEDQPLEPLLGQSKFTAILPHDFIDSLADKDFVPAFVGREEGGAEQFLLVHPQVQSSHPAHFILSLFISPDVQHGVLTQQPTNLLQLHEFCRAASMNLLQELYDRIKKWKAAGNEENLAHHKLILCIVFPKRRELAGQTESRETWLFATASSLTGLAETLGIFGDKKTWGYQGYIVGQSQVRTEGSDKVQIEPLRPTFTLDRSIASILNGTQQANTRIVAIGLGAVGSHVFDNLVKSGFGSWTLVDKDHLLPHNCARHVLDASAVTMPKAEAMRVRANNIIPDLSVTSIVADVLSPGDKAVALHKALNEAEVILDMSASTSVSRHVALDVQSHARRASVFLNPTGDTLVTLFEDSARTAPLDWLEMVYYFGLTTEPVFAEHFKSPGGFRYSRSCGDISSRISQDLVALHSATASRTLRVRLQNSEPAVLLYRVQDDFSTKLHAFPVRPPVIQTVEGWTILTHPAVFQEAACLREAKLPNETGGVLLGSMDTHHRRIYVMALLPSPPDSQEWPTLYIRGVAGLRNRVQSISEATYNNIDYIGEWHSHPPRSTANLSGTDRTALSKLADEMRVAGLPALMLIVAGAHRHQFHIRQET